jgi:hypothetical protein
MLRITQIEEIANLLLLLPALIHEQEQRSTDFVPRADAWLNSLERVFSSNRLYQAGSIATLRSALVATKQGQVPAGIEFRGPPSRSQVLNAAASHALQRAADIASTLMAENQPRLSEADRLAQQIASAALSRGLIKPREAEVSNTQYLRTLRRSLAASDELENAFVHIEGLVGLHDALILFDRALASYIDDNSSIMQDVAVPRSGGTQASR